VEPRSVAQRAVRLVDVAVEGLADDRVPAARRQRLQLGHQTGQLAAGLVEDDARVSGRVARVLRAVVTNSFQRGADDLHRSTVGQGKLAIERAARVATGEHDADIPVRTLVDHEVPSSGAEYVEPENPFTGARDFKEVVEAVLHGKVERLTTPANVSG